MYNLPALERVRQLWPHRLEAQDTALSRREHRFESGWGCQNYNRPLRSVLILPVPTEMRTAGSGRQLAKTSVTKFEPYVAKGAHGVKTNMGIRQSGWGCQKSKPPFGGFYFCKSSPNRMRQSAGRKRSFRGQRPQARMANTRIHNQKNLKKSTKGDFFDFIYCVSRGRCWGCQNYNRPLWSVFSLFSNAFTSS